MMHVEIASKAWILRRDWGLISQFVNEALKLNLSSILKYSIFNEIFRILGLFVVFCAHIGTEALLFR